MDRGAHFVLTDLQVHSPRDPNWKGSYVTDADREQFAREFIAACRNARLGAVAITDHHDFAFVPYIRRAARSEVGNDGEQISTDDQIVVFPGLELTLAVPCQALLIFSADFPDERLSAVLDKLSIDQASATNAKAAQPLRLEFHSLHEVHSRLDETDWLRGQYILLPHVTDGGHGTLIRQAMHTKYIGMPCVGGYVEKLEMGDGTARILAGQDPNWGNKRTATILTSDARTLDSLGTKATWIKWAEPTAEALRQACLAKESRIAFEEPGVPSVHITRLSVSNSKFLGPVILEFNAQSNALIGGRGTGKSSCLEYLRWGLCDQPPPPGADDEGPDLAARRRRLIDLTLEPVDGQVEVHFLLNGIPHVVRRYSRSGDLHLKIGSNELMPATESEVRALLPIQAYSQRQLSDVGIHLDELTRFVTAPIQDRLSEIDTRRDELSAEIRENFVHLQRVRVLERAITRDKLAIESLNQQAAAVRETLGGLSAADQSVLREKPGYDQGDTLVKSWQRRTEQAVEELERTVSALKQLASGVRIPSNAELPKRAMLDEIQAEVQRVLVDAERAIDTSRTQLLGALDSDSPLSQLRATWSESVDEFSRLYATATTNSSTHEFKLKELQELENKSRELQETLDDETQQLGTLGNPAARHVELRAAWSSLQGERANLLEEQCTKLTDLSDNLIRATIHRGVGTTSQHQRFKSVLQGAKIRSAKLEAFFEKVASAESPLANWHAALDELEEIILAAGTPSASHTTPMTALKAFSTDDLDRMTPKLSPETILDLSLMQLDDHPVFEYRAKEGEYIEFADASAGQQATALLRVLLNQSGPPLLIDQPEDDLDSQVIQDIVNLIWKAKTQRQLIFSSHNANLVVNGDAELVVCFNYRSTGDQSTGYIELEGAIDIPTMREKITSVMEGGEKAFRLRKEKYGF